MSDGERVLAYAGVAEATSSEPEKLREAGDLLRMLIAQDVVDGDDGKPELKQGVTPDRTISVSDPEMRTRHKSASSSYHGFKTHLAVATTGPIVAADVTLATAHDADPSLDLVKKAEITTRQPVMLTLGDCAYGIGANRARFEEAGRKLIAKLPHESSIDGRFTKADFKIDLKTKEATCPAGHTVGARPRKVLTFWWRAKCNACPLRERCTADKAGRSIHVTPFEGLMQRARAELDDPVIKATLRQRVYVEHAVARVVRYGGRKARFFGLAKARFQVLLSAAISRARPPRSEDDALTGT